MTACVWFGIHWLYIYMYTHFCEFCNDRCANEEFRMACAGCWCLFIISAEANGTGDSALLVNPLLCMWLWWIEMLIDNICLHTSLNMGAFTRFAFQLQLHCARSQMYTYYHGIYTVWQTFSRSYFKQYFQWNNCVSLVGCLVYTISLSLSPSRSLSLSLSLSLPHTQTRTILLPSAHKHMRRINTGISSNLCIVHQCIATHIQQLALQTHILCGIVAVLICIICEIPLCFFANAFPSFLCLRFQLYHGAKCSVCILFDIMHNLYHSYV